VCRDGILDKEKDRTYDKEKDRIKYDKDKDRSPCKHCKAKKDGRNLILSFDGTSNQFGENVAYLPIDFCIFSLNLWHDRIRTLSSSMPVLSRMRPNLHTTIAASAPTQDHRLHPLDTGNRF
jgi:hypothetical protein